MYMTFAEQNENIRRSRELVASAGDDEFGLVRQVNLANWREIVADLERRDLAAQTLRPSPESRGYDSDWSVKLARSEAPRKALKMAKLVAAVLLLSAGAEAEEDPANVALARYRVARHFGEPAVHPEPGSTGLPRGIRFSGPTLAGVGLTDHWPEV